LISILILLARATAVFNLFGLTYGLFGVVSAVPDVPLGDKIFGLKVTKP
jgi:hypothetical protein